MPTDHQLFRSRVDRWLSLLVTSALVAMWLAPVRRLWAGRPVDALDVLVPLLATAFITWIFRSTCYVIAGDVLIVRSGPLRRTVPLGQVQRLRATNNPLSSPALSIDRIEVTYGTRRGG